MAPKKTPIHRAPRAAFSTSVFPQSRASAPFSSPSCHRRRPGRRPSRFISCAPHAALPNEQGAAPPTISSEEPTLTFGQLEPALPLHLLDRLSSLSYHHPTATQAQALPHALSGRDVLLHAQTGSGKTLCYALPCITRVEPTRSTPQALVLVPTPELGLQVYREFRKLTKLSVHPLLEGADARKQRLALREAPRILVGNPARVWHLASRRRLRLDLIRVLAVDEYDACLADVDEGTALAAILAVAPAEATRQTILASATAPQRRHFLRRARAQHWLRDPVYVTAGAHIPEGLRHATVVIDGSTDRNHNNDSGNVDGQRLVSQIPTTSSGTPTLAEKLDAAATVLRRARGQRAIVFVSQVRDMDTITDGLLERGVLGGVYGLRREWSIAHRRHALQEFRAGRARILVATDLAARGIDIPDVDMVMQLDVPRDADGYLHRAGRAGRLGRCGSSILVVGRGEEFVARRFGNSLGVSFTRVVIGG